MEKKVAIPVPSQAALAIQDIQSTRWGSVAEGYMFAAKGNAGLFTVDPDRELNRTSILRIARHSDGRLPVESQKAGPAQQRLSPNNLESNPLKAWRPFHRERPKDNLIPRPMADRAEAGIRTSDDLRWAGSQLCAWSGSWLDHLGQSQN